MLQIIVMKRVGMQLLNGNFFFSLCGAYMALVSGAVVIVKGRG